MAEAYNPIPSPYIPMSILVPTPAVSQILAQGLNPFHTFLGSTNVPLNQFDENVFWGPSVAYDGPAEAFVTANGIIHIKLRFGFRIDLSMNNCIRIVNEKSKIAMSVAADCGCIAMVHPMGCVVQDGNAIDVKLNNNVECPKFAALNDKGIRFKSHQSPMVYFIDDAGTKTSGGRFNNFEVDPTVHSFYSEAITGPTYLEGSATILRAAVHWMDYWYTAHWLINGIHVAQALDGTLTVKYGTELENVMETSDRCGTAMFITPSMYCTASTGGFNDIQQQHFNQHLYLKNGVRRIYSNAATVAFRHDKRTAQMSLDGAIKITGITAI